MATEHADLERHPVSEADLRRERFEIEVDPEIAGRVTHEDGGSWGSVTGDDAEVPATTSQGGAA